MKNPNGYGSVFKLSGNRRKPWCARVTVGWTDEGKQQYKNIGYYEERSDALIALAKYNDDPYDLDSNKITFAEVYEKWSEEKFPKISDSNIRGYRTSFNKCSILHGMKFKQIRKTHMQRIINENSHLSYQVRMKIKTLFVQLYKFGIENDIVEKDYARFVDAGEETTTIVRTPFSDAEIQTLWNNIDKPYVDSILIMIYTGMRVGELLTIETKNIQLDKRILIGGIKTKASIDRIIPIHERIVPLINLDNEYLIMSPTGKKMSYNNYIQRQFTPLMKELGMNHLPHDCRHTTATLLDNAGVDKTIVKMILGHTSNDITERVYTHKTPEQLVSAINKI
jgi:site-specific recombinase XerD